jgi:hypothetical protein
VEINGDGSAFPPPVGTPNDRLDVTGAANILNLVTNSSNKLTISVQAIDGYTPTQANPMSYTIATVETAGNIKSNGVDFVFDSDAYTLDAVGFFASSSFQLAVTGNQLVLTFTPVPEPGLVLAVAGGFGLVLVARRKLRTLATNRCPAVLG